MRFYIVRSSTIAQLICLVCAMNGIEHQFTASQTYVIFVKAAVYFDKIY